MTVRCADTKKKVSALQTRVICTFNGTFGVKNFNIKKQVKIASGLA